VNLNPSDKRAQAILRRLGKNPVGVELGVFRGSLSRRLLTRKDLRLTMVDSWGTYRPGYKESGDYCADQSPEDQEAVRSAAEVITRFGEDRRTIIRDDTVKAAGFVPDGSLDFVFVDADHSYGGCMADMEAWVGKLRPGGLLCGHDYIAPDYPGWYVKDAVTDFAAKRGLTVETDEDDTWFIRLPGPLPEPSAEYDLIVFACVKAGTKYDPEYVNILADMVARNCEKPYVFCCLTDDRGGLGDDITAIDLPPGLTGWWNKVALFKPGMFPPKSRIVYLDLDVIVCGPLEPLIDHPGIASDWLQGGYNSSVMVWNEGEHDGVWHLYTPLAASFMHGDQDWIEQVSKWPSLPSDWIVSYRLHAQEWPPEGAMIVAFHGEPKPHEISSGWVRDMWTIAGLAVPRYTSYLNNDIKVIRANVAANIADDRVMPIQAREAHNRTLLIAAGGPSLADTMVYMQLDRAKTGGDLWALNGSHDYLIECGIIPDGMVMLDSRPQMVQFVQKTRDDIEYFIATQCDPSVFDVLVDAKRAVQKWTGWYWGVEDKIIVGGGATVGQKAICLGYVLGYRKFKLYGYDSSYRAGANHAYSQPMNDGDLQVSVVLRGRKFIAARWMVKQVVEFLATADTLTRKGCQIEVYGDGLLPYAASIAARPAEMRIPA